MIYKEEEKSLEQFLIGISKLEPFEFMGLTNILGVKVDEIIDCKPTPRPLEKIMEELINKFLGLNRKRRKEILGILKDARRGK